MNSKALKILEYDKIIDMLTSHATCDPGRELCRALLPMTDYNEIIDAQKEVDDALTRIRMKGQMNYGSVAKLDDTIARLNVGASIGMPELLRIGNILANAERVSAYGGEIEDSLSSYFKSLYVPKQLKREIERCIVSEDTMADDASTTLLGIRRQLKSIQDKMHSQLNSILNANREYLMDPVIAIRDGSYCLPIKTENKNKVPGVIHDQSASGSTLFIEPMAVIELNNSIRELEAKDKQEVSRILDQLSALAVPETSAIKSDIEIMTHLDFVWAKAKLAQSMNASMPIIGRDKIIDLIDARHPLLPKDKTVPISIKLGEDYDLLIITGPNTGGKTVSLKTVGLLTLMAQSGLQIPAFQKSRISIFEEVYADIGDEQSIEQSLSTFSGHMKNIVEIVNKADYDSLCLFDELGAGTDPTEGAALAIAVLSFLHRMQVRTIATTHYSELKVFALNSSGVENAACEFDVETLRPTYRILTGIPGKSNAFAISRKLGLPQFIIDEAGQHIEKNDAALEDLIAKLDSERAQMEKEKEQAEAYKKEIEILKAKQEQKSDTIDAQKEKILNEARAEAKRILSEAKETADDAIKKINKYIDDSELYKEIDKERSKVRSKLKDTEENPQFHKDRVDSSDIALLKDLMSGKRSQVSDKNHSDSKGKYGSYGKSGKPSGGVRYSPGLKSATISPEINLIGKNVDEACAELDKYLDDALLSKLAEVRIIHGRGTGALQKGIHAYLKKQKFVKEYHLADFQEGGNAITIVKF